MRSSRVIGLALLFGCAEQASEKVNVELLTFPWDEESLALPSEVETKEALHEAHDIYLRERFEVVLDAHDPGELLEHASLTQISLDRGVFDNDDIFIFGDELFDYDFRPENGWGDNEMSRGPTVYRAQRAVRGGPDSFSCSGCHSKGGLDGAGSMTQHAYFEGNGDSLSSGFKRNAPHLLGLGPVQAIAQEMTLRLQSQRAAAINTATTSGQRVEINLNANGVNFGELIVSPSGEVNAEQIEGIDSDLVVRPFGWKGRYSTIREVVEFSFHAHLGIVSANLQQKIKEEQVSATLYGEGPWYDIDDDGVSVEIEDGMITSVAAYLAQLAIPQVRPPSHPQLQVRYESGRNSFERLECNQCHKQLLVLENPQVEMKPEHPDHAESWVVTIDVAKDGEAPKPIWDEAKSAYLIELYSDLKRHDMGPELSGGGFAEDVPDSYFLTRPLWGLADSAPYLHDGRALTLHDAIRLHGGEASASRDAYLASPEEEQANLRVFLLSLSREPTLEIH